jgi:tetratricopeptide (TPR) repeat protein
MDIGSLMAQSRGLLDAGRYAEAVRCLESAVRRQPTFPDLHNQLGLALSLAGEPLRAESHLQRALELNPGYAEAHLNLAILLFERNAYAAARDHMREFNRIVRGNAPGFPDPALDDLARRHADLAERYRAYGLLEEAESQLRSALRLRPAYGDLRLALVRVLFERSKLDEAAEHVQLLLQQRPGYQDAQLLRGHIEMARGNPNGARAAWLLVREGSAATVARALLDQLESGRRAATVLPRRDSYAGGRS